MWGLTLFLSEQGGSWSCGSSAQGRAAASVELVRGHGHRDPDVVAIDQTPADCMMICGLWGTGD